MELEVRFSKMYLDYWDLLYQIAQKKTGDKQDALDIVQETFMYVWQQFSEIQLTEKKTRSYLITCLYYRILSHFRIKGISNKQKAFFQTFSETSVSTEPHSKTVELEFEFEAIQIAIAGELDKMPERMKTIFTQSYYQNKSVEEIAETLSISEKTVRNQISVAKKRLKEFAETYPVAGLTPLLLLMLTGDKMI